MQTALKTYLLCSLALCSSLAWSATPAGSTPGSFSVSNAGAATYDLPIQAPPGIAGFKPQLSLRYDSQAGRGVAGLG
ncbi:MAG: hypothetical protein EOP50_21130, partial [Sphingobacteriales bacterium]